MIPKIIHQTWKTEEIPDEWKDAVYSCKVKNPDYKYILWTDKLMEEFVKYKFPDFYKTYMGYPHNIQRCDTFRYLVLYIYGGIYLDLDIVCKKNLDPLLSYEIVLSRSYNINSSFTNSFIAVTPYHPFIKFCIEELPNFAYSYALFGKHLYVTNSTGAIFLTNMLGEYKLDNIKDHYVLSNEEFQGDCNVSKCSGGEYFTHLVGKSWNGNDSLFYNFCFCHRKIIGLASFILIVLFFLVYALRQ
jgi:mannosyltransferase OCH1-like enzyme